MTDPKNIVTIPVNIGGEPPRGKGGTLGQAEIEFTTGGIYIRVTIPDETVAGENVLELPTIGFDRSQLTGTIVSANLGELFGGSV